MKNIKVRTKLTIILALVIVLVTSESFISIKNMNQLKDKALETMDTSSRQNYDDSIKEPCYRKSIMSISLVNILLMKLRK